MKRNATVPIADVAGSLTMKGQALLGRFKDKDYYDVYALTGFHNGEPKAAAEAFGKSLRKQKTDIEDPLIFSSLGAIRSRFEKVSSVGPFMVSSFIGDDAVAMDAFERVNAFLDVLQSAFSVRF